MELEEIDRWNKASPGEYVYHTPTKQIGLCGKFDREADIITIIAGVNIITDSIKNFRKIKLNKKDIKAIYKAHKYLCNIKSDLLENELGKILFQYEKK